jgi:hypothetical protein
VGYNPDDFEFLNLAERLGLGTADLSRIELVGQPLAQVETRLAKVPGDEPAHFGQSNRTWLIKGPLALADSARWRPDPARLLARPGADGWSAPLYFDDDRIRLGAALGRQSEVVAYAYAECTAPRAQAAELWVGSSDDLVVWLNGAEVYRFAGSRSHHLPCDRVPVELRRGSNALLVEVTQHYRDFDFSLNLCEPETDPRYDGTRVAGLKFTTPRGLAAAPAGEARPGGSP